MKVYVFLILALCVSILGCNSDNNNGTPIVQDQTPTITSINPNKFARGQQRVDLTITGTNLNGANVVGLGDGTTVHSVSATSATEVKVNFSVQRLAVPGPRDVFVTTTHGTATAKGGLTVQGDAPQANFTIDPKDISQSTDVNFDGSSSTDADGTIKSWSWDFGDGKQATGKLVTHKFTPGTYHVSLTVTDNDNQNNSKVKDVDVKDQVLVKCENPAGNNGFLGATVIGVDGHYAIVQMQAGRTCANSFYLCGDMRLDDPEEFRGIIKEMYSLGNNQFKILNDCPYKWPPKIGEYDVLIYKSCAVNFCP